VGESIRNAFLSGEKERQRRYGTYLLLIPKMGFMLWYRMYARWAAWYSGSIVKGSFCPTASRKEAAAEARLAIAKIQINSTDQMKAQWPTNKARKNTTVVKPTVHTSCLACKTRSVANRHEHRYNQRSVSIIQPCASTTAQKKVNVPGSETKLKRHNETRRALA